MKNIRMIRCILLSARTRFFPLKAGFTRNGFFPRCTILAAYRDEVNSRKMMEEKDLDLQEKYHADIRLLVTPLMHVASHELRQLIKEGQDISPYVPEPVVQYIKENGLYRP